jgi:predicted RNase H-like HicB family nuclease
MSDAVRRYPINVFWSDEDEGFIATVPDLPGCSAFGETKPEAVTEIERAIEAWIEAARAAGNPIPEPSRLGVEAQPSGRLLVRMPKMLHASLVQSAKREAVSLNQFVVFLLTKAVTSRTIQDAPHPENLSQLSHHGVMWATWHKIESWPSESFGYIPARGSSTQEVLFRQAVIRTLPAHTVLVTGDEIISWKERLA